MEAQPQPYKTRPFRSGTGPGHNGLNTPQMTPGCRQGYRHRVKVKVQRDRIRGGLGAPWPPPPTSTGR